MINFFIGLFLGANFSLFLYACILAGRNADKGDEKCKKKDIIG